MLLHTLLSVFLSWVLSAAAPAANAESRPTLLVLGDSLSTAYGLGTDRGWVDLLETRLADKGFAYQVVNASVSGETSAGGRSRLEDALKRHSPSVVVIELGGNDALGGTPIDTISNNLEAMIRVSMAHDARVLLVGMRIPPNYGPDYADSFERMYVDLADRYQLALVPFLLEDVALTAGMMQADGIHPTEEAQPNILETVWPHLKPLLDRQTGKSSLTGRLAVSLVTAAH